jgi:hypothetical protein
LHAVVAEVPTCPHLLQLAPAQRSIRYCVIVPPVSVAAVHVRFTCVLPDAVAARFVGAVNVGAAVVAVAVFEYGPVTFVVSIARTR